MPYLTMFNWLNYMIRFLFLEYVDISLFFWISTFLFNFHKRNFILETSLTTNYSNTPNELNIQKIEPDCVFEEEIDSSKRRNKKWLKKNRKINYTRKENEYERTKFRKTLNKLRKTRKANLQKKYQSNYQEFESFKSLEVASKSQDWLDKKTLELFAKLKEVWPRIFKRLEKLSNRYSQKQICSGTQNGNFLFTWQQGRFSTKISPRS